MKKSTIGVIIAAVSLIIIGGGLFVGGIIATGGIRVAKEELAEHGVFIEDGFHVEINHGKHIVDGKKQEHPDTEDTAFDMTGMEEITFPMEEVESLYLEVKEAEVEFGGSSDKEISIRTDGGYEFKVRNKVLYIKPKGIQKDHKMLIEVPNVQVPEEFLLKDAEIHAGASNIYISQISAKEFDLEVGAGQVTINQLVAEHAEFDIGAGEVIVEYGNVHECDTNVEAGNFEYTGMILRKGDVECNLGNAEYYLEREVEDYNYEIDCGVGNVDIGDENFSGLGRETYIDNHVQESFDIECNMGNVSIDSVN